VQPLGNIYNHEISTANTVDVLIGGSHEDLEDLVVACLPYYF
jgi:hypothetical protein